MYDAERSKRNYQYYLSRGLCPHCGGKNKVEPGSNRCRECAIKNSESKRRTKERRIAEGRCTRCGEKLADNRFKTCEKCRAYIRQFKYPIKREWNKDRYDAYREKGICASCGRMWVEPGHAYCEACRKKNRAAKSDYDPDGEKKRAFREERRRAGLCIDCGRPVKDGASRCKRCAEGRRDSSRKWRIHQRTLKEMAGHGKSDHIT